MTSSIRINRIDSLEPRFLLASFASLNAAGVLSVVGTSQANVIDVAYSGTSVKATRDGSSLYFDKTKVKKIWAEGFGGNDNITNGVPLPSTLIGDAGNDTLVGNAKNDEIHGGSGNDDLVGADGTNILDAGSGSDVFDYSAQKPGRFDLFAPQLLHVANNVDVSNDQLTGDQATILLTTGNDTLTGTTLRQHWSIDGNSGNDNISLTASSAYSIRGGAGNDTISFDYTDYLYSVYGGSGNDVINDSDGSGGTKVCDGGPGHDSYIIVPQASVAEQAVYTVYVPPGIEVLKASSEHRLEIYGNELDNDLTGTGHDVVIYGNGGNDRIDAELNPDPSGGWQIGIAEGDSGNDTLVGSGNVNYRGGSGNDTADFSSRTANLKLTLDNDDFDGVPGEHGNIMDDVETILGGSGNDSIVGSSAANLLVGNGGNDTIEGSDGNDTIFGGDGNDVLLGQKGDDQIHGGAGDDWIWGGTGNDTLWGDAGHDHLFGENDNDTLYAKDGQTDTLDGGNGTDTAQRDNSSTIKDSVLNIESFI